MLCPCGSEIGYLKCCGLYIEQSHLPSSPEALMRSRYTAYTLAKTEYIQKTMKGTPLLGFDVKEAGEWAKKISWVGLKVLRAFDEGENKGFVEFIATLMEDNKLEHIHEISEFHREDDVWYYVDGVNSEKTTKRKPARNAPCPCGSLKTFKNCHGKEE